MGSVKSILPTDFPSLGIPWLIEAATSLYGKAKVADRIPQVANLVISNVPGPPVALYMAGAKMMTNYPTSIIVHGMGLNITVQSYDHSLDFGLMADAAAMPDVRELADAITVAFDDLRVLPLPGEADSDEPEALGVATTTRRRLTAAMSGAVGKTARALMNQAIAAAAPKVTSKMADKASAAAPIKRRRAG
jgi:diacylglycerol O-acyltransferase / wax synthase